MNPTTARREFLKLSGAGLAMAAAGAFPAEAAWKHNHAAPTIPLFFDVRSYGATGDGKTVDSPAINAAIAAAAAVGGGTVFFGAGNYVSFSIRLMSNVNLYLAQGCTLIAAESPLPGQTTGYMGGTYDAAEPKSDWEAYQDYGHNHWHNSLIWGEDLNDISITGPGLIFGKGLSFGAGPGRPPGGNVPGFGPGRPAGAVRPAGPRNRGNFPIYQAEQDGVGNKSIALKNCRNVTLSDFSILKGGHFGLLMSGVDNLIIDNLKIDTDRDGMDIDCCRNVRVSNCSVNSPWDDAIVPKSSYALGSLRSTDNVTITNCYVSGCYELGTVLDGTFKKFEGVKVGGTGRIKCGTESNGGFRNITVSNCVFDGCQGLALETVDGALLEDIAISNITMRDIISAPIFLRLGSRLRGPADTTKVGTLRRVLIDNLVCYNTTSKFSSIISGIPGYQIEDVKLSNIYVQIQGGATTDDATVQPPEVETKYPEPGMFGPTPYSGFYIRHTKNIELSNVEIATIQPDARPVIAMQDVQRADFINLETPYVQGQTTYQINDVTELRILQSRNLDDMHVRDHIDQKDI